MFTFPFYGWGDWEQERLITCLRSHSKPVAQSLKSFFILIHTETVSLFLKSSTVPGLLSLHKDPWDFWACLELRQSSLSACVFGCFCVCMSVSVSVFTDAHYSGSNPSIPPKGGQGPFVLQGLLDRIKVLLLKEKNSQTNLDLALS